jgi:hypothetical protein
MIISHIAERRGRHLRYPSFEETYSRFVDSLIIHTTPNSQKWLDDPNATTSTASRYAVAVHAGPALAFKIGARLHPNSMTDAMLANTNPASTA